MMEAIVEKRHPRIVVSAAYERAEERGIRSCDWCPTSAASAAEIQRSWTIGSTH
jgi:hypothetical protein